MTVQLEYNRIVEALPQNLASSVIAIEDHGLIIQPERLTDIAAFLKVEPGMELDYLCSITGVDCINYFEIDYLLYSIKLNHRCTLKVRLADKSEPAVPSLAGLWLGAELQEREIFDLLGINFSGHPDMKRIFLWEGFPGHPLRKDYGHGC
ncbi:MAG: NADH-quinone oxidoreductase subunit C [Dehalococcoidaceae bacterium]|nr:NADH-quinone oxidoreductase subunit C [Dehalococcoidaceae bacterium]